MEIRHPTNDMRKNMKETLLKEQVLLLEEFLKRGRKRAFEDILGKKQAAFSSSQIADEWEFIRYDDAGNNWRKESKLFCDCGRKLRYQYILRNRRTGLKKSFGLNHLTEHTGIQPEYARLIVKELARLEREGSEIVEKWINGWTLQSVGIEQSPAASKIPASITWHLSHEIPLLERQVKSLKKIIREEDRLAEEKLLQMIVAKEKKQLKKEEHL